MTMSIQHDGAPHCTAGGRSLSLRTAAACCQTDDDQRTDATAAMQQCTQIVTAHCTRTARTRTHTHSSHTRTHTDELRMAGWRTTRGAGGGMRGAIAPTTIQVR